MAREELVVRALVEMADTLVGDFDVVELLTGLASRCVELLGISAAGVMVATAQGDVRLVASSSEAMRILELFELQAEEGPCLDAYRSGEPVDHLVLAAAGDPWPRFSVAALEAGFHSVSALPLRLRDSTIGALNLFSVGVAPMSEPNTVVARAFADLAAISILQHRSADEHQRTNEQLSYALNSRIVIEQAKGIIAERAGIGLSEAFDRLRGYARDHNLRLTEVAHAAVDGTLEPGAWSEGATREGAMPPQE
ncbi:MAG: GAF and ANTAR domain-containing protein [Actinomycetota bacterium]|nr:GAF and ANTAR domain-containing protein [Actinomycetota bacterium]